MECITARTNPLIVATAKLKDRKYREREGLFFFEGEKLFEEALAAGVDLVTVFCLPEQYEKVAAKQGKFRICVVSRGVYEKLSEEKSPEGLLCVAKHIDFLHKRYIIYGSEPETGRLFAACQIRDPGNLGTILRTANALGIDTLLLSDDCADLYHPKTVRAAMGAVFRQKTVRVPDMLQTVARLREEGRRVYAAALTEGAIPLPSPSVASEDPATCFLVGNEGHGLPSDLIAACDDAVILPMQAGAESLNAAIASSILIWEATRGNRKSESEVHGN